MQEIINTYFLNNPDSAIPMDRDEFYAEQISAYRNAQKPTRAADIVAIFIFNTRKELLLQKRNYHKAHNPGLIDKSMGGHIRYGDAPDFTVMVETVQELQTPSIVMKSTEDFRKAFDLLQNYLQTIAIVKHIQSKIFYLKKVFGDETVEIANKTHVYFGLYDGSVKPADGEAQGVLWYTLNDLSSEMEKFPDAFSNDLRVFLREYATEIDEFCSMISGATKKYPLT